MNIVISLYNIYQLVYRDDPSCEQFYRADDRYDSINRDICNELICTDHMDECCCATYVSNIVIVYEYRNKSLYGLLFIILR